MRDNVVSGLGMNQRQAKSGSSTSRHECENCGGMRFFGESSFDVAEYTTVEKHERRRKQRMVGSGIGGSMRAVRVAAAVAAVLSCGCPVAEGFTTTPVTSVGAGSRATVSFRPSVSRIAGEHHSAFVTGGWLGGVPQVGGGRIRQWSMRAEEWTANAGPFSQPTVRARRVASLPPATEGTGKRSRTLVSVSRLAAHSPTCNNEQSSVQGPFQSFLDGSSRQGHQQRHQHPICPAAFSADPAPRKRKSAICALSAHQPADAGSESPPGSNPSINQSPRGSDVVPLAAAGGLGEGEASSADGPGSRNGVSARGDDETASARPSPLRWVRRTLRGRVVWGRGGLGGGIALGSRAGRGFRGGLARRVSSRGPGEDEAGGTATRDPEDDDRHGAEEDASLGWNLSGWTNEGRRGWASIEGARRNWSASRDRRNGGGPGLQWLRGSDSNGAKDGKWGGRVSWAEKGGGWADDLHIRTVAKIHTLLGREDQAEEMELNLIRDPYLLGDASWVPESVDETAEWRRLEVHRKRIGDKHLKDVMQDTERSLALSAEYEGTILDFSRMNVSQLTMKLLMDLAKRQELKEKILAMYNGDKINNTEDRAVLHVALRTNKDDDPIMVDGVNVVEQVHQTLDHVKTFSEAVRSGKQRGATNKLIRNIVAVGIGGSYLGPEFVHEAFKTQEYSGREEAELYRLRFLSNVDPVDVRRTLYDLDPEETLVVVISKTFTTAETMLNARTARQWLWDAMGKDPKVVQKHMAACASESAMQRVVDFGIPNDRLFPLWDWVGGRYSVCSSVGALPLSLKYGFQQFENFLDGARSMDMHFLHAPFEKNLPVLMGLLGVWNISFMGYKTRTILPYAEALLKFPAHIQQLAMESNGKRVTKHGKRVQYDIGQVDFGEPGTNGQHSFFQLLHMGQICPAEFIGFIESQHPLHVEGEPICSHDELMANFFAQPDALAIGKGGEELKQDGCQPDLIPHRTFDGNRPSLSLLVPKVNSYHLGQLLALYEHRTAVEGFMWDINSFDQWGVELGKSLATSVREKMQKFREDGQKSPTGLNPSTQRLMSRYLQQSDSFVKKVGNINHTSKNMAKESR